MFMRVDKLLIELPMPKKQDSDAGAALQELFGGKYGEMSTLNNYMYQSFNFRSKSKLRAIYDIVASITAEEVGHVELVANGVAMLNNGPDSDETGGADISDAPFSACRTSALPPPFFPMGAGPCRSIATACPGTARSSPRPAM
jgi:Mn-containing catalase